jgi:hypothetical protein
MALSFLISETDEIFTKTQIKVFEEILDSISFLNDTPQAIELWLKLTEKDKTDFKKFCDHLENQSGALEAFSKKRTDKLLFHSHPLKHRLPAFINVEPDFAWGLEKNKENKRQKKTTDETYTPAFKVLIESPSLTSISRSLSSPISDHGGSPPTSPTSGTGSPSNAPFSFINTEESTQPEKQEKSTSKRKCCIIL